MLYFSAVHRSATVLIVTSMCRSDSMKSCVDDCEDNDDCGCAFWRPSDHDSSGYCALTTAECSDPIVGAQVDYTRIRTAIIKCSYTASDDVREDWPDETYDGVAIPAPPPTRGDWMFGASRFHHILLTTDGSTCRSRLVRNLGRCLPKSWELHLHKHDNLLRANMHSAWNSHYQVCPFI